MARSILLSHVSVHVNALREKLLWVPICRREYSETNLSLSKLQGLEVGKDVKASKHSLHRDRRSNMDI